MLHFIYTIKAASGPHILLFLVCGIATLYRIWSKGIRKNFFEDGGVHKTCSCEGTNGPWGRLSSFIRSHEATLAESKPPLFMDWLPPLYTFGTWSSDRQEKHKKSSHNTVSFLTKWPCMAIWMDYLYYKKFISLRRYFNIFEYVNDVEICLAKPNWPKCPDNGQVFREVFYWSEKKKELNCPVLKLGCQEIISNVEGIFHFDETKII